MVDPRGLAFDPTSGTLFGIHLLGGGELVAFDPATGVETYVGFTGLSSFGMSSLAFDPTSGTLYSVGELGLLTIDPATGTATPVGVPTPFQVITGLAFDPTIGTLFGVDIVTDDLVTIDRGTGAATTVGPTGFDELKGLTFDPTSGTLFGVDNTTGELVTIDPTTAAATVVGATGFRNIQGLAFAVPTPGAAAVLGLGGLFAARRRRP